MIKWYLKIIQQNKLKDIQNHQSRWFSLYDEVIMYVNKRLELRKAYEQYEQNLQSLGNIEDYINNEKVIFIILESTKPKKIFK